MAATITMPASPARKADADTGPDAPSARGPDRGRGTGPASGAAAWARTLAPPVVAALLPAILVALPHDWRFLPLHLLALGGVLALAGWSRAVDGPLADSPGLRWGLLCLGAGLLTWTLFGESPRATWDVIDDHAVHTLIGPGRDHLPAGEILPRLAVHPEAGAPVAGWTRYRPAYYTLYLGQAAVWGKDARPWFVARLLVFAFSCALGFDLLRRWLGMVAGAAALAAFAALWMWPEIVIKLGSGETYAAPACLLFAWTAVHILESPVANRPGGKSLDGKSSGGKSTGRATGLAWLGLTAAALVAIGSKENFVVLAPLALLVAAVEWWRGDLRWPAVVGCLVVCAAAATVAGVVAAGIATSGGRDVYQRPVGLAGLVAAGDAAALRTLRKLAVYGLPLAALATGAAVGWLRLLKSPAESRRRSLLLVAFVLLMLALSQVLFYRGEVFKKCRYDLPFVPIVGVLSIGLLVELAGWRRGGGPADAAAGRSRLIVAGTLAVVAMALGGDHARADTRAHVLSTTAFQATIGRIAAACDVDPARPVVCIVAPRAKARYEPVVSVAEYLRSRGITNRLHLSPVGIPTAAERATAAYPDRLLSELSADGSDFFEPWQSLPAESTPIELWFSADPPPGRATAFRVN